MSCKDKVFTLGAECFQYVLEVAVELYSLLEICLEFAVNFVGSVVLLKKLFPLFIDIVLSLACHKCSILLLNFVEQIGLFRKAALKFGLNGRILGKFLLEHFLVCLRRSQQLV